MTDLIAELAEVVREAFRAGFIEACQWGEPVSHDVDSNAFTSSSRKWSDGYAAWNTHHATLTRIIESEATLSAQMERLKDPEVVHAMMLRGVMAVPSIRNMVHLRGPVHNTEDGQLARIAELQEQKATLSADHEALVVRLGEVTTELEKARKDAETERKIQNAARDLPEGYVVTIYVEKDSGYIDLTDPDGDPVYVHTDDKPMAEQIAEATKAAAMHDSAREG